MKKNIAASVRARLDNKARASERPFQEVLQYYGLERFLYRLSRSKYRDQFVLKGALMLQVWGSPKARPTKDIDLLGKVEKSVDNLVKIVRELCEVEVEPDGIKFDEKSVRGERIKEDADYQGVRLRFIGNLARAEIPMQIDVAFGDVVSPQIEEAMYPTLLGEPPPKLKVYPRETQIAEKFQAMVALSTTTSRMKDFYDIWFLSRGFDFDGAILAEAIAKTFANRSTQMDPDPAVFSDAFMLGKQSDWAGFVMRSLLNDVPDRFIALQSPLKDFLLPVARAVVSNQRFNAKWTVPGPWKG